MERRKQGVERWLLSREEVVIRMYSKFQVVVLRRVKVCDSALCRQYPGFGLKDTKHLTSLCTAVLSCE